MTVPGHPPLGPVFFLVPRHGLVALDALFGGALAADGYNATPLYAVAGRSPQIFLPFDDENAFIAVYQLNPVSEFEDDLTATLHGILDLGGNPVWEFSLSFTAVIGLQVDAPNNYEIQVDGFVHHLVEDPHLGDPAVGFLLLDNVSFTSAFPNGELLGADVVLPPFFHPGGHVDEVTRQLLTAVCCDRSLLRPGIKRWNYSLNARRSIPPPPPPEVAGDPHFQTWGGHRYDYHGECDLVLLSAPQFGKGPLDIHIRTKIRYGTHKHLVRDYWKGIL